MNFDEFYVLNEAGFGDRMSYMVKKHGEAWNLHWIFIAAVAFTQVSKHSPYNVLTDEEMKSPKTQKDKEKMYSIWRKIKSVHDTNNREIDAFEDTGNQSTQFEHDEALDLFSQLQPIMDIGEPTLEIGLVDEFEEISFKMDPNAFHAQDARAVDVGRGGRQIAPDDKERVKPLYTEWLILSFIRGDFDNTIGQMISYAQDIGQDEGPGFHSGLRNWADFEDGDMIRNTLEKFDYYKQHNSKEFIDSSKVSWHSGTPPVKDPLSINQYKGVVADHMNTGTLSTFHGFDRLKYTIRQFERAHPDLTIEKTRLDQYGIDNVPGTEVIGSNDKYVGLELIDYEGAEMLCKDMGWCIQSADVFEDYSEKGSMFVFVERHGDKLGKSRYLLHPGGGQAKARDNRSMTKDEARDIIDIVIGHPELKRVSALHDSVFKRIPEQIDHLKQMSRLIADGEWRMIFKKLPLASNDLRDNPKIPNTIAMRGQTVYDALQKLEMVVGSNAEKIADLAAETWRVRVAAQMGDGGLAGHKTGQSTTDYNYAIKNYQSYISSLNMIVNDKLTGARRSIVTWANDTALRRISGDKNWLSEEYFTKSADLLMRDLQFVHTSIWFAYFENGFGSKASREPMGSDVREASSMMHAAASQVAEPYHMADSIGKAIYHKNWAGHDFDVFKAVSRTKEQGELVTKGANFLDSRSLQDYKDDWLAKFYDLTNKTVGEYTGEYSVSRYITRAEREAGELDQQISGVAMTGPSDAYNMGNPVRSRFHLYALYRAGIFEKVTAALAIDSTFRHLLTSMADFRYTTLQLDQNKSMLAALNNDKREPYSPIDPKRADYGPVGGHPVEETKEIL